ncbi:hypothetical protein CAAN1_15S03840 [[Candida] anglica]|uniref:Uncharacterized protein n=1 Tax=[Candida] anglica TaxID=148631 RepID=A0ABP0E887_9ASCO
MGLLHCVPLFIVTPFYMVTAVAYNYSIKLAFPEDVYNDYIQKQNDAFNGIFGLCGGDNNGSDED